MLAILIIVLDICITALGIYLFDYASDSAINNILVVSLSILGGLLLTVLLVALFIQLFYISLSNNKLHKSKLSQFIAKQLVSVPIHYSRLRIKVVGKENLPKEPGFSIYLNHTSWIDLPVVMYKLNDYPVASLGKEGAFKIPMIGKFAPKFGCVMIHRSNPRQGAEAIKEVITNVQNGFSMVIFPEGTRNPDVTSLLEFKPGAFKVALKSGKPLVPITIVKAKDFKSIKWPFLKRITMVIHEPLLFEDYGLMKTQEISKRVKEIIEGSLEK